MNGSTANGSKRTTPDTHVSRKVMAVVNRQGRLTVEPIDLPRLGPDQLRVRPLAVGVCGTDLSAWLHPEEFLDELGSVGATNFLFDPSQPVVFGHEFTSEVLEVGSRVADYSVGDRIYTMPIVVEEGVMKTVGYSNSYPGALCEEVIVESQMHILLDDHVNPVHAAVLDPICTGIEGARRTGASEGDHALVTGVGPVGLGAVVELAARGAASIVVSDPSPARRKLALQLGATDAVDPRNEDPIARAVRNLPSESRLRVVEASGASGVLDGLLRLTPRFSIIAVVGASTTPERVSTLGAATTNKTVIFASGPDYGEMRYEALYRGYDLLRTGQLDAAALITVYTGLAGAPAVFDALRPGQGTIDLVKPIIIPGLSTDQLLSPEEFRMKHGDATP